MEKIAYIHATYKYALEAVTTHIYPMGVHPTPFTASPATNHFDCYVAYGYQNKT